RGAVYEARRQGLRACAWFEYGLMLNPGAPLARQHPDWLLRTRGGRTVIEGREWLDPAHPGVRRAMMGMLAELAAYPGLSTIQLDDHWGVPAAFGDHRAAITALTREAHRTIKAVDASKRVTLTPHGARYARERYNQDWLPWVHEGLVEEVVLQAYRPTAQEVATEIDASSLDLARRRVRTGVAVFAGFDVRPFTTPPVAAQLQVAADKGHGQVLFVWEYWMVRRLNGWLGGRLPL
ncbi:MAG: family 10 glycosylhydrolase, partial [Candidatus Sericytochromatia bacterium]|nr:family 10 glycosylhydrolase [Candidatus Sericytochromatia bacterium]